MNVKEILDGMADRAFAYSFLQGINDLYSSRDYGDTEPDYQTGFNRLLEILTDDQKEALNRMEGIYTERRYYADIELCNQIDAQIMQTLSEEEQEHMVSVACAWQQRVYSAAMDGFYCGYRAAYEIMNEIDPLVKVRCVDKILAMEYHLGYIQPYSEVERLRDMAA